MVKFVVKMQNEYYKNKHNTPVYLGERFWNDRYNANTTSWDLGQISPPLKAYINQLTNKNLRILIPGCGNSYEADYLLQQGFTNVTILDISTVLVKSLQQKFAKNPDIKILLGDFFTHQGPYDLVFEQTFFCALHPTLRKQYVQKMHQLLSKGGKLVGVLFNREFEIPGPPFGGSINEYKTLFLECFEINKMELCNNSYHKRAGTELFIKLINR